MSNKQHKKDGRSNKTNRKKNKSNTYIWIGLIVAAVVAIAVYYNSKSPDLLAAPATRETIKKGKKIFNQNCSRCHGEAAKGENPGKIGGGKKANGSLWAPALNGTAHSWHHRDMELFKKIKNGSSDSNSPMKGFEGRLSDNEIIYVMHYFKDLWPMRIKIQRAQKPHH